MRSFAVGVLALAAEVAALPAPQGVTENIPPSAPAPAGCQASYPGSFMITVQNVTSTPAKVKRQSQPLMITLADGVLKDAQQRTGYVASNYQFQFDGPPQAGAIYTSGFSVCSNGSLALGGSAIWWQCYSGGFYNLYDRWWAEQCSPIYINVLGGSAAAAPAPAAGAATQLPDGQPGVSTQVQQIGDGQVQATPVPVGQIADGQVQGPTGAPVGQIGDGQIQAPTGAPVGQIGDGQVQAPTGAPVGQIGDGQVQAPTGAPVGQIGDGQVQAPTGAPVGQIGDGQVQAPTGAPVGQIGDGQVQAPTGAPVGQIGDGQVQAPTAAPAPPATTAAPVGQIGDGQVQAPTGAPVGQIGDGQVQVSSQVVQAASPTSSYQPLQVTANAAPIMKHEGAAIVAGLAAAMALL